ncbi:MAG: hypothetical protein CL534_23060 [Ahrensia sp.]|nr:hypothetical protein [Ahrensia sp.]
MNGHPARTAPSGAVRRARHLRRSETDAEGLLWWELKSRQLNGYKFARQVPLGPYIADFVCRAAKLVVEVDGSQHADNPADLRRTRWMNNRGYSVLRFWNHEVLNSRQMVLSMIVEVLEGRLFEADPEAGFWPSASSPHGGEVPSEARR